MLNVDQALLKLAGINPQTKKKRQLVISLIFSSDKYTLGHLLETYVSIAFTSSNLKLTPEI